MLLRPLIAAAGLTAAANAFLVNPELSTHDVQVVDAIPVESVAFSQSQTISLDCPGCPPVFKKHNKQHNKQHNKHHSSHLELAFSIDTDSESNRLMVNGFELYPNSDPFSNVLVATQVADKSKHHNKHKNDDAKAVKSHHKFRPHDGKPKAVEQQLGFSLQIQPAATTTDDGLDLVVVDLQIIEVGSVFVDGLPNVRVSLIKNPENELIIAKVEQTPSENVYNPTEDGEQCTTMICKWRAIIAAQLEKFKTKGCAGMLGLKGSQGHGHPHSHHGHHPGHMTKTRQHGWAQLFRKLTSHIILPILVGIVAGVSVSIIGMIIGTVLVGLWRKVVRGQSFFPRHHYHRLRVGSTHHHHRHHKTSHNEAAVADEKVSLMENEGEDLPPSYEEGIDVTHVERV